MIHANVAESGVFFGVLALTLLLLMFLYAVITADPQEAARTEAPLIPSPALAPPRAARPGVADAHAPAFPVEASQPSGPGYAATHAAAASVTSAGSVASLPQVSGDSQRELRPRSCS